MVWGPSTSTRYSNPAKGVFGVTKLSRQIPISSPLTTTLTSPHPLLIPPHHHITPTMSTSHSTPSSTPCSKGHGHLTITPPSPHHYTTPTMLTSQHHNCMDLQLTTGYCPPTSSPVSQDMCQGSLCALGRVETPADHEATV